MNVLKKWLSRKVIVSILTVIADIFIFKGDLPAGFKTLLAELITGLAGLYVVVEGIADIVSRKKSSV